MSSAVSTALSVGSIIGVVLGVLSAIATLICCIMLLCYCWKNKNRNQVWANRPPPYYYQNQSYGQSTNTPYYYQQPTITEFDEKY